MQFNIPQTVAGNLDGQAEGNGVRSISSTSLYELRRNIDGVCSLSWELNKTNDTLPAKITTVNDSKTGDLAAARWRLAAISRCLSWIYRRCYIIVVFLSSTNKIDYKESTWLHLRRTVEVTASSVFLRVSKTVQQPERVQPSTGVIRFDSRNSGDR